MRLIDADALIERWKGCMFEGDITLIIANAPTIEPKTEETIIRQAAIDALADYIHDVDKVYNTGHLSTADCEDAARSVLEGWLSVQPDLTLESAINYLYSVGWMESHDKQMYEDGQRHAQPEIVHCRDCKHLQKWRSEESAKKFGQIYECARNVLACPKPEDFCSYFERRTNE